MANDQFRLSGLGLSASFAYDDNKRIVMSSPTPIKFIDAQPVSTSYPSEFAVKDASGIKYTFGTNEKTRYEYYYGPPELTRTLDSVLYTSAWHLCEVSDPCGNKVRFVYSDKTPTKWRESGSTQEITRLIENLTTPLFLTLTHVEQPYITRKDSSVSNGAPGKLCMNMPG